MLQQSATRNFVIETETMDNTLVSSVIDIVPWQPYKSKAPPGQYITNTPDA